MNQRKTIVLCSRLNPHDVVSGPPLGGFASDCPDQRFSVYAFAVRGPETADQTAFGPEGRCK